MKNILQQEQELFEEKRMNGDFDSNFSDRMSATKLRDFLASSNQRVHIATLEGQLKLLEEKRAHIQIIGGSVQQLDICEYLINELQTQINEAKK